MITYVIGAVCALLSLVYVIYIKLKNNFTYWERKGIKGPKPHWILGNLTDASKKQYDLRAMAMEYYDQYPNDNYVGFYQGLTPTLLIKNPECIKRVLIQDFGNFVNRGFKINNGPMSRNLFEEESDNWRILRQKFTPMFSSGKLKQMMPIANGCVKEYVKYVDKLLENGNTYEVRGINLKYTMKSIISAAFGLDIDTFNGEKHKFLEMAEKFFEPRSRTLASILDSIKPGLSDKLVTLIKKEISDFFIDLVKQIVKDREGKPKVRNDFMDLMIKMKEQGIVTRVTEDGVVELQITDELMAAQAMVFYVGGFDTSASTMSFLFHELAANPHVQDRCYEEIKLVMEKYNGELTFESLNELIYVSMALDETLRKYPIAGELFRISENKYTFPETNLTIDKGTKILIPLLSMQNDSKHFDNPDKFDPERFAPENKRNIKDCTYIPFGDGPRICIGMRFARVQSMLGIAHFLYNYRVDLTEKSMKKLRHDPAVLTLSNADGLWLNIKRR